MSSHVWNWWLNASKWGTAEASENRILRGRMAEVKQSLVQAKRRIADLEHDPTPRWCCRFCHKHILETRAYWHIQKCPNYQAFLNEERR